jgi:hypothetical protein
MFEPVVIRLVPQAVVKAAVLPPSHRITVGFPMFEPSVIGAMSQIIVMSAVLDGSMPLWVVSVTRRCQSRRECHETNYSQCAEYADHSRLLGKSAFSLLMARPAFLQPALLQTQ